MIGARALFSMSVATLMLFGCGGETPPAKTDKAGWIDRERLLAADANPGDWLTTGRDFGESHYSPLDAINRETVSRLGFAWSYETGTLRGLEATPIVVDGVMYASGPWGAVYALDAKSGAVKWTFDPEVDGQALRKACCDAVNRGVAVWKGKVYVGALDGRLFALDAATGKTEWVADTFHDHERGMAITGAPAIAGNVVVIGYGGGELDARGSISAYDLETGAFKWRFFIVPGDPKLGFEHPEMEMAAKTWDPNSRWDMGLGGTAWDALVYDPELNLLYVGTGNAALYNQAERSPSGGDNLFLSSILAIDPDSGRLAWHYQETPGESWDLTATQPIILADLEIEGATRKALMHAPKNGFFYILDRATGEFLSATQYSIQNWALAIDPESGKPTVNREAVDYSKGVKLIAPSQIGAHAWHPMAYSPKTGLVYIPAIDSANYMFDLTEGHVRRPGLYNTGVSAWFAGLPAPPIFPKEVLDVINSRVLEKGLPDLTPRAYLRAWDPVGRKLAWEFETAGQYDRSGVLATGGGLIVQGTGPGKLRIRNDETGEILKDIDIYGSPVAAPMTYTVDGEQYIALMVGLGGGVYTYAPPPDSAAFIYGNDGYILAFKLDGGEVPPRPALGPVDPIPEPPALAASPETVDEGAALFAGSCGNCHFNAPRGYPPDLRRMSPEVHASFNDILLKGMLRPRGMPQWDDIFTEEEVEAIHAYLIALAWDAYRAEQAARN